MAKRKILRLTIICAAILVVTAAVWIEFSHREHTAVDALVEKLKSDDPAAAADAARRLSLHRTPYAVRRTVEAASEPGAADSVKYHATSALVAMGGDAVDSLLLYLQGKEPGAGGLLFGLWFVAVSVLPEKLTGVGNGPSMVGFAVAMQGEARKSTARDALVKIGQPAVTKVAALAATKDPSARRAACYVLARIGGREAMDTLAKAVSDPDAELAMSAVKALGGIDTDEVREIVRNASENAADANVRAMAAQVLGDLDAARERRLREQSKTAPPVGSQRE